MRRTFVDRNGLKNGKYGIYILFVVLTLIITLLNPNFFTLLNIRNIFLQVSINGILAVGVTLVLITGGIDMSVGSILAFAGVVCTNIAHPGQNLILALILGLVAGGFLGAVNGFLVAYGKIPPFIVTLGMLSIARGLTNLYTNGRPVIDLDAKFIALGQSDFLFLPIPVWFFLIMLTVGGILLHTTVLGRKIFATGSNEEAAVTSGIHTGRVKLFAYTFTGVCCGLAGILLAARTNAGATNAGTGYELDVIAAVIIGGNSLSGGKGTMFGTMFGVLILGIIQNGLDVMNVSTYAQQLIKGAIIIGAVWLDKANRK